MGFVTAKRIITSSVILLLSILVYSFWFKAEVGDYIQFIKNGNPNAKVLDNIQFVSSWSPSSCGESPTCRKPPNARFMVHGLWPAEKDGVTINDCPTRETSTTLLKVYKRLGTALSAAWFNVDTKKSDADFWDHEWFKHGSCSKLTPDKYFGSAIIQAKDLDFVSILAANKIIPSKDNTYSKSMIEIAIQKKIGQNKHIYISCKPRGGKLELLQLYICLDKTATTTVSCPEDHNPRNCGGMKERNIIFLPN